MPDYLRYIHGGWLVVRASHARQFTLHTRCLVSRTPYDFIGRAAGELSSLPATKTKEEKGKGQVEKSDRNCERKRSTNRTRLRGAWSDIVMLLLSILAQFAPASCTCAVHQYSKCCSLQLCMYPVILSLLAKTLYTCGLYLFHD